MSRVALALGVHGLTASGAVVGVAALLAIGAQDFSLAALLMLVALFIDSVDGTLARAARVKEVLPRFDGRRLDDMVDYLNYVIVPCVFLVAGGLLPHWWAAAPPIPASAYGFSQVDAKTEDDFFLGFPSYWNVIAIYAWLLEVLDGYQHRKYAALKREMFGGLSHTVLELGAGDGANFRYLAPGTRVIAIEPNVHMHRWLRARAARHPFRVLDWAGEAPDHPQLLAVPETHYLKCAVLQAI